MNPKNTVYIPLRNISVVTQIELITWAGECQIQPDLHYPKWRPGLSKSYMEAIGIYMTPEDATACKLMFQL